MTAAADSGVGDRAFENLSPILFVEDAETDFELARRCLEKTRIINPIHCVPSIEALGDYMRRTGDYVHLQQAPFPVVVLLDMMLQQTSGVEAQAMLRANFKWRKVPIIILSIPERMGTIKTAVELGAAAFMLKPFQAEEFCRLAKNLNVQLSFENDEPSK